MLVLVSDQILPTPQLTFCLWTRQVRKHGDWLLRPSRHCAGIPWAPGMLMESTSLQKHPCYLPGPPWSPESPESRMGLEFFSSYLQAMSSLAIPNDSPVKTKLCKLVRWLCTEAVGTVKTALDEWIIWGSLCKSDGFLNGHHMGAGRWLAKVSVLLLLDRLPSSLLSMKGTDTKWLLKPLARLCLTEDTLAWAGGRCWPGPSPELARSYAVSLSQL
jgi:hypothetical protein